MLYRFLLLSFFCAAMLCASQDILETVEFTPPKGWKMAEKESLPTNVKVMVVGQGKGNFPPSINLSTEEFGGNLRDYLQLVKNINQDHGSEWKDLGSIFTEAGEASLSQAVAQTSWGDVKMIHVILVQNGMTYILTAAALKDEFPLYYKDFFRSLRSLRIKAEPVSQ